MSETPKLEIEEVGHETGGPQGWVQTGHVVTVDWEEVTDEENEAAAVLIRCMREEPSLEEQFIEDLRAGLNRIFAEIRATRDEEEDYED